jgi:hypothetical protein
MFVFLYFHAASKKEYGVAQRNDHFSGPGGFSEYAWGFNALPERRFV